MEIFKEWQELNEKLFLNQSLNNDEIMKAITSESSSAIATIKKGLKIKSYWCLLFISGFTALMIFSRDNIESVIVIGIVNLMYVIGFFRIRSESKKMNSELQKDTNVLESMKRNAKIIQRSIYGENIVFVFGAPIIILCSLFYSHFNNGETFQMLINDSSFLKQALIWSIVSVPLVYFLGKFLNDKSFGPHISELEKNINKLEGVEFLKTKQ